MNSDTTRTMIGQKGRNPMFYCTGKLPLQPLPDKVALTLVYLVYLMIKTEDMILIYDHYEYLLRVVH